MTLKYYAARVCLFAKTRMDIVDCIKVGAFLTSGSP
jgi:hypothetical protein